MTAESDLVAVAEARFGRVMTEELTASMTELGSTSSNDGADRRLRRNGRRCWSDGVLLEKILGGAAPKAKAAVATKPKAIVVGVKRKAAEKPKLKPAAKAVQTFAKATPCVE
ncbi:hypothetical protein NL676_037137 [Syzygium grande]|nr:hypothetical protein NL676_037137 [Syzygium grande]